jgi:hypothetical protein
MHSIRMTGIKIIGFTLLVLWVGSILYNSYTFETSEEYREFQELVIEFNKQTDFSNDLSDPSNNFGRGADFFYNSDEYLGELERLTDILLQMQEFGELAKGESSNDVRFSSSLQNLLRGSYIVDLELQVISTYHRRTSIYLADEYYYQVDRKLSMAKATSNQLINQAKLALEMKKGQSLDGTIQIIERTVKYMTEAVSLAQMAKGIEDSR